MKVEQLSVFLENTSGRLSEVTGILSEAGVNIRALSLADTSDFGVLRMILSDIQKAEETLRRHGFTLRRNQVVAVEVEDRPGGLHRILKLLHGAAINVEYMYAFVQQSGDNAVMIFRFDRTDDALQLLRDNGVAVIEGPRIYTL